MIASLPLYDWPETRAATGGLWRAWRDALRRAGADAPDALIHDDDDTEATYARADLLTTQLCGYRIATDFAGRLEPFAAPVFDAPGCDRAQYASWIVVRREDASIGVAAALSRRIARNGPASFSGWVALGPAVRAAGVEPAMVLTTGSHRASARAVADGAADVASIDAYCLSLLERFEPETASRLVRLERVGVAPAPPFAAPPARPRAPLRAALQTALTAPDTRDVLRVLGLRWIEPISSAAYAEMGGVSPPPAASDATAQDLAKDAPPR